MLATPPLSPRQTGPNIIKFAKVITRQPTHSYTPTSISSLQHRNRTRSTGRLQPEAPVSSASSLHGFPGTTWPPPHLASCPYLVLSTKKNPTACQEESPRRTDDRFYYPNLSVQIRSSRPCRAQCTQKLLPESGGIVWWLGRSLANLRHSSLPQSVSTLQQFERVRPSPYIVSIIDKLSAWSRTAVGTSGTSGLVIQHEPSMHVVLRHGLLGIEEKRKKERKSQNTDRGGKNSPERKQNQASREDTFSASEHLTSLRFCSRTASHHTRPTSLCLFIAVGILTQSLFLASTIETNSRSSPPRCRLAESAIP